jgi:hypothetical protein
MTMTTTSNDQLPSPPTSPATPAAAASPPAAPRWRPSRRATLVAVTGALFLASNVAGIAYFSNRTSGQAVVPHPAVPTKTTNDRLLEALGCESAVHLYQSYLNIGLIADAVAHKTYTPQEGSNLLSTVAGLMDVVDKQLEGLDKMDIRAEDREGVQRIRALASLMRVQLASLRAYWLSGDSQHADRYQQTREQAWSELSKILGL